MATTPNMGLVLPTDHATSETWGAVINSALGDTGGGIDGHDHSTGKGVKVPTAGLNINADLSLKPSTTAYALTDVKAVDFNAVASSAVTALAGALFMSDGTGGLSANELYWRTTGGTNVKLTNGAALNVAAFTGGIGGDYTAVSAAENYDNANLRYTFFQGGGTLWARLHSGQIRISETGTNESIWVGMSAPAALASSYSVTWPVALPGATQLLQVDNAGQISFSNTVSQATSFGSGVAITGPITGSTISPAALASGNNNNWAPTGFANAVFIRLDATGAAAPFLTGIAAGTAGRLVHVHNISAVTVVVSHLDASSSAANQILTPTGAAVNLAQNQCISFFYDGTTNKWRFNGKSF